MQFGLSESQHILQDSAREFFAGECPMARVRRLMDTDTADDAALWSKLAGQEYTWENDRMCITGERKHRKPRLATPRSTGSVSRDW